MKRSGSQHRAAPGFFAIEYVGAYGHLRFLLLSKGSVTMLTLVMPDCFTASMTVANAPKGTFSSERR